MSMEPIEIEQQIKMCSCCFEIMVFSPCTCGCTKSIEITPVNYEIIRLQEDRNAPIKIVRCGDYVDAELVREAGVVG